MSEEQECPKKNQVDWFRPISWVMNLKVLIQIVTLLYRENQTEMTFYVYRNYNKMKVIGTFYRSLIGGESIYEYFGKIQEGQLDSKLKECLEIIVDLNTMNEAIMEAKESSDVKWSEVIKFRWTKDNLKMSYELQRQRHTITLPCENYYSNPPVDTTKFTGGTEIEMNYLLLHSELQKINSLSEVITFKTINVKKDEDTKTLLILEYPGNVNGLDTQGYTILKPSGVKNPKNHKITILPFSLQKISTIKPLNKRQKCVVEVKDEYLKLFLAIEDLRKTGTFCQVTFAPTEQTEEQKQSRKIDSVVLQKLQAKS